MQWYTLLKVLLDFEGTLYSLGLYILLKLYSYYFIRYTICYIQVLRAIRVKCQSLMISEGRRKTCSNFNLHSKHVQSTFWFQSCHVQVSSVVHGQGNVYCKKNWTEKDLQKALDQYWALDQWPSLAVSRMLLQPLAEHKAQRGNLPFSLVLLRMLVAPQFISDYNKN